MQWHIVKDPMNTSLQKKSKQPAACIEVANQDVIHVGVMNALTKDGRTSQVPTVFHVGQKLMISVPGRQATVCYRVGFLHLGIEKGGNQLARQKRRTDIHPGVLVHFPSEKLATVGPFLSYNFRPLDEAFIVNQQCTAFSGNDVLCLVKAESRHMSDTSERFSLVTAHDSLGGIFYNQQAMLFGSGHDGIHLTGHARIMNNNDCPGFLGNSSLNLSFIEIQSIRADIYKDRRCASQNKGIGCRDKSVGRHYYFITRLDICKNGGHLQSRRTGIGHERLFAANPFFQPGMTLAGEWAVPG